MINETILKSSNNIKEQVEKWNNFSSFPLKGELWEERLSLGFNDTGYDTDWEPNGNHVPGVDFSLPEEGISFSCKSGKLKNGVLSISSYRTTKYPTLQEKLDYHDSAEAKPFTHYAVLVRDEDNNQQHCLILDKSYISAKSLKWEENIGVRGKSAGKLTGWSGESENIEMKIQRSMSDQFWYYLDWSAVEESSQAKILFTIQK